MLQFVSIATLPNAQMLQLLPIVIELVRSASQKAPTGRHSGKFGYTTPLSKQGSLLLR